MLSIQAINEESFPIALIKKEKGRGDALEVIHYTEPKRGDKPLKIPFRKQIEEYLETPENPETPEENTYTLKEGLVFEMLPTISAGGTSNPRFANMFISASNSGKSYRIAQICKRYLQAFPENTVCIASANPIENDVNYDEIRDHIKEIDVLNLDNKIDFTHLSDILFVADDCDSGFSANLEHIDKRLTPAEIENLSVSDRQKALRMLKVKAENASTFINESIVSLLCNGRKRNISLCVVSHKVNEGRFENKVINESTGIVLFPASMRKTILERFIVEKLGLSKEIAKELLYGLQWFRYDFLYISHRTSTPFAITQNCIKLFPQ